MARPEQNTLDMHPGLGYETTTDQQREVGTRPHRAARLTETRERLRTATETRFPARSFEATSVRDLAIVAYCNLAAVHDHRGSTAPRSHSG